MTSLRAFRGERLKKPIHWRRHFVPVGTATEINYESVRRLNVNIMAPLLIIILYIKMTVCMFARHIDWMK